MTFGSVKLRRSDRSDATFNPPLFPKNFTVMVVPVWPVIIKTGHTGTTITVKFFGNNGGLKVASERSDRRSFTDPKVIYEENPLLSPGTEKVVKRGSGGWTVTVTRVI